MRSVVPLGAGGGGKIKTMDAWIENGKSGNKKVLIVPYTDDRYESAIQAAERLLNPKNEPIALIAIPVNLCHTVFSSDRIYGKYKQVT